MNKKEILKIGTTIARELINTIEKELIGKQRKEKKNVKRKKVSSVAGNDNNSS